MQWGLHRDNISTNGDDKPLAGICGYVTNWVGVLMFILGWLSSINGGVAMFCMVLRRWHHQARKPFRFMWKFKPPAGAPLEPQQSLDSLNDSEKGQLHNMNWSVTYMLFDLPCTLSIDKSTICKIQHDHSTKHNLSRLVNATHLSFFVWSNCIYNIL